MNEERRPSFYAIIPAYVRYCKELEPNAKLLYGELTALAEEYGYCWASNAYFAELYGVTERMVQFWLASLKKHGFIKVEIEKEGIKTQRKIWISGEAKKMFATRNKLHPPPEKNFTPPTLSPYIHINTERNNTSLATQLSLFFFQEMQKINPKIKAPRGNDWEKEFDRMLSIDKHSEADIRKIIAYIISTKDKVTAGNFRWCHVILSPAKLRKHFATLWAQGGEGEGISVNPAEANRKIAENIIKKLHERTDIHLGEYQGKKYIEFTSGSTNKIIYYNDENFKSLIIQQLKLRKINMELT